MRGEIRVQIRETPLFYVPNDFEINGPTKERDFHFNAGSIHNYSHKTDVFLMVYKPGA